MNIDPASLGIYLRVSSDLQAKANGVDSQRHAIAAWKAAQGLQADAGTEYADEAVSGASMDRPAWNRLLGDIRGGTIRTVVLYDLSRAGRTLKGLIEWVEEMVRLGVRVVFVKDNLDISTAMERMILQIMGSVTEFSRHETRERVKAGVRAAIARGEPWGGQHQHPLSREIQDEIARRVGSGEITILGAAKRYKISRGRVRNLVKAAKR